MRRQRREFEGLILLSFIESFEDTDTLDSIDTFPCSDASGKEQVRERR